MNNEYKKNVGRIVGELTNKHYGDVYSTDNFSKKTTFTHIIFYKNIQKSDYTLSAIVPFETVQTFNVGEILKIKVRKKISSSNNFDVVVFNPNVC